MLYKCLLLVSIFLLVVLAKAQGKPHERPANYYAISNDCVNRPNVTGTCLIVGSRRYTSMLAYDGEEKKIGVPLIKRDTNFEFNLGQEQELDFITGIEVLNLKNENKGHVTLTKGGVGHTGVTLLLESERGEGYHFHIKIYAEGVLINKQRYQKFSASNVY